MPDTGLKLKIKYGLIADPSPELIRDWVRRTETYVASGLAPEDAGRRAAKDVFPDFDRMLYKAEADTVLALLDEAKRRPGPSGR